MKIKDLLDGIERCRVEHGDNFMEWDIYTEQIDESDKATKKGNGFGGNWKWIIDSDDWEYIECAGFWTKFADRKAFTINVTF